jgi:hypothetical protein
MEYVGFRQFRVGCVYREGTRLGSGIPVACRFRVPRDVGSKFRHHEAVSGSNGLLQVKPMSQEINSVLYQRRPSSRLDRVGNI